MAVAARLIERLESEGYLGADGRTAILGRRVERRLESLRKRLPRAVGAHSGVGAMHAFLAFDGSAAAAFLGAGVYLDDDPPAAPGSGG